MIEEANKVNQSTIMNFLNAPLMASFRGTKENIVKFIINRYHNGKVYFDKPMEISAETIYKLTRLSNKGDHVPIGIKGGLVENGNTDREKLKRVNCRANPSHHTQNGGQNHICKPDCHRTHL